MGKKFELVGLTCILLSYVCISSENLWPGYLALIPVFGAYLILISDRQDSIITNNVIFQYIGKWSYSIYLWHWPIVVFGYYRIDNWFLFGIPLSILMGWVSYRWIESFRFTRFLQWKKILYVKPLWLSCGVSFFSILVLYSHGADVSYRQGATSLRAQFLDKYQSYELDPSGLYYSCNSYYQIRTFGKSQIEEKCVSSKVGGVFLWGDSHMAALSTGLRKNLPQDVAFSQLTSSGCSPSFMIKRSGFAPADVGCNYSNGIAYESIEKSKPKIVILGARRFHQKNDWLKTVEELKTLGVEKVIIMGPFPQWLPSLPLVYFSKHLGEEFINDERFDQSVVENNRYLEHIHQDNHQFVFIDLFKSLCTNNEQGNISCRAKVNDELIAFDYGHLTTVGSDFVVKNFVLDELKTGLGY